MDQAFSTLEVVPQLLPFDQDRQLAVDGDKQWIGNEVNGGLEVVSQKDVDLQTTQVHHVLAQRLSARRRIMFGGIVGLLVICGAVLGGVLGSRHQSSVTASSTSPFNSSVPSLSVTPTQRNIAAVSFTSHSANNSRVYFQDDEGQIIEASSFEPDSTWSISKIGIGGKNGSAIAAAVSPPSRPLVGLVFFYQSTLADRNSGNQSLLSRCEQPGPRHHIHRLDG